MTTPEPPAEPVRVEVAIEAPPEEVWRSLREPELAHRWFGWEYDGLDDEVASIFGAGSHLVEEGAVVQFGGHRLTVVAGDGRTLVQVTRCAPVEGEAWDDVFSEDVEEGWLTFLQQLRFALERHPGQARRTIFLQGVPDGGATAVSVLGLGRVAGQPAGAAYSALVGPGEAVEGQVWFRSAHQLGVTVAGWGDGLLVVGTSSTAPPPAPAMVVGTLYGVDEAALAERRSRWESWWAGVVGPGG